MKSPGRQRLPRLALWLLERVVWSDDHEYAAGDFEEMYRLSVLREGVLRARIRCWWEVLRSLPGFINNSIYWGMAMLWNYLKVAVRNLARQKGFSFINIVGLAVGIASCLVISLWVYFQFSFDRFHQDSGRIYQVLTQGDAIKDNPSGPAPIGPTLVGEFPQVEYATRYERLGRKLVSYRDDDFYETVHAVDASFFQMFSFDLLRGDRANAFPYPNSAIITEDLAAKYFGDTDPLGQTLTLDTGQPFTITGVVASPPANSSLKFHILVPFEVREAEVRRETGHEMGWGWFSPYTFIQLRDGIDPIELGHAIQDVPETHSDGEDARLTILPLTERHLLFTNGYLSIYLFSSIGFLVLLIASINFVNLSTARSARRAREVGLRKVVGAFRKNVIHQFLGETIVTAALAVIVAVVIVTVALPSLNAVTGLQLSLAFVPLNIIVIALLLLVFSLGIAAGSYPAFLISSFRPVTVLKSEVVTGKRGSGLRRLLVVIQFAVSAVLILGTVVIWEQVSFSLETDPGYDRENVISVPLTGDSRQYYALLQDILSHDSRVVGVAGSADGFPLMTISSSSIGWTGKDPDFEPHVSFNWVDYGFVETMGLELVAGRAFSQEIPSDAKGYMINETLARMMGGDSAVGRQMTFWNNPGEIIGVMKDFCFLPTTYPIEPMVFLIDQTQLRQMTIRLSPQNPTAALAFVRETWEKNVSWYPFQYSFLTDDLKQLYSEAADMGKLLGLFAGLALFVASLGMLGLAACAASTRSREIAIRKVLGAGAASTVALLGKELAICLLVANLIAWPSGYILMSKWLEEYSTRIEIGPGLLLMPFLVTVLAAGIAVGYQTFRAARANPIEPLKYE